MGKTHFYLVVEENRLGAARGSENAGLEVGGDNFLDVAVDGKDQIDELTI